MLQGSPRPTAPRSSVQHPASQRPSVPAPAVSTFPSISPPQTLRRLKAKCPNPRTGLATSALERASTRRLVGCCQDVDRPNNPPCPTQDDPPPGHVPVVLTAKDVPQWLNPSKRAQASPLFSVIRPGPRCQSVSPLAHIPHSRLPSWPLSTLWSTQRTCFRQPRFALLSTPKTPRATGTAAAPKMGKKKRNKTLR